MHRTRWLRLALVAAVGVGCPRNSPEPQDPDTGPASTAPRTYPGMLIDPATVPRQFLMRQRIRADYGDREIAFESVVQKKGEVLTVIGMTPFGTRAFSLVQTGTEVEFTAHVDRELPFPPEYILQDIHRAFLWDVRLPNPPQEGAQETETEGERVRQSWEAGRLRARSFERIDGRPEGLIRVEYGEAGMSEMVPTREVVLVNGWFGYRLEIETVDYQSIPE
jgi:hypothetical protein